MTMVLVVEDEPSIADAVVSRLRSEGFDARAEGDGLRAVEVCRLLKPDLVVLDLMLPGIDGLEVCRRIQADRRVPVVMLTARDALDLGNGLFDSRLHFWTEMIVVAFGGEASSQVRSRAPSEH